MASREMVLTSYFLLAMGIVFEAPTPTAAEVDVWQELAEIEVFKLKDSAEGCPPWLKVLTCPKSGIFVFYKCCGMSCCRRFQGWVLGLLGLVISLFVLRTLMNLVHDVFCCRYRKWKKDRARKRRRDERRRIRTDTEDSEEDCDDSGKLREVITPPSARSDRSRSRGCGDGTDTTSTPRRSREVVKKKHKGLFSGWRCERREKSRDRRRKQPDGVADTTTQEWIEPTAPGEGTQPPS